MPSRLPSAMPRPSRTRPPGDRSPGARDPTRAKAHAMLSRSTLATTVLLAGAIPLAATAAAPDGSDLERRFERVVRPFLKDHCLACHGAAKPKAQLDLGRY